MGSPQGQRITVHRRTAGYSVAFRPGLVLLTLAVAMAFSVIPTGTGSATSPKPSTGAGAGQGYPVLENDAATTLRDQPVPILVAKNDTDPDPAGLHVVGPPPPPKNGTATAHPDPDKDKATIVYTPNRGFVGTDTFQYDYCPDVNVAGQPACPAATVTVTVTKPAPEPVDDPDVTTVRDQPVPIDVMRNDRNPDVASLQVSKPPRPGAKAEKQPDGTIRYTPEPGFVGEDSFQYDYCGAVIGVAKRAACPAATVTVTVTATPIITSVRPGSTPPGRPVEVGGNTGSCERVGTLTFHGMVDIPISVTADQSGNFTARFTVPKATFPRAYTLELRVDCNGQIQRAEGLVTVTNQVPVAADDSATTTRDHPVTIPVTKNDRDPDDPDGYQTFVVEQTPPANGRTEVRSDTTIIYTPNLGFVGRDEFRYSLCDDVVNAAGGADCGTATVTVTVTDTPIIASVRPGSTFAGMSVEVGGNTGSCNRAGTLTFHGMTGDVSVNVTADQGGNFVARVTIPKGTFPRAYQLELTVDCKGQLQRAQGELTVINVAPVAADDAASTTQDSPVEIAVTANDRNPGPDTGYPTRVLASPPTHGTTEVRSDQTIVYTPEQGFVGKDRFQYSFCDDVVNAAGGADCGTATVTVTVMDAKDCLPSPGNIPTIKVNPSKGRGGAKLGITATVDRKLAACPFRLLLGGTPLPPDVRVGSDGNISAERGVPNDAKPGPNPLKLATMSDQTLAEAPFQIVPSGLSLLLKLVLGAGALLAGALARAAFRRWRASQPDPDPDPPPEDVRAEPHTSPVDVTVEPEHDNTRTYTVRLEPHPDPGTQTVQEMTR
jgi:Big-like domain-containing protein